MTLFQTITSQLQPSFCAAALFWLCKMCVYVQSISIRIQCLKAAATQRKAGWFTSYTSHSSFRLVWSFLDQPGMDSTYGEWGFLRSTFKASTPHTSCTFRALRNSTRLPGLSCAATVTNMSILNGSMVSTTPTTDTKLITCSFSVSSAFAIATFFSEEIKISGPLL